MYVCYFHVSKRPIARSFMCKRSVDYMKITAKSWVQNVRCTALPIRSGAIRSEFFISFSIFYFNTYIQYNTCTRPLDRLHIQFCHFLPMGLYWHTTFERNRKSEFWGNRWKLTSKKVRGKADLFLKSKNKKIVQTLIVDTRKYMIERKWRQIWYGHWTGNES